jgi:membrane-bound serine protease (ClpP class)
MSNVLRKFTRDYCKNIVVIICIIHFVTLFCYLVNLDHIISHGSSSLPSEAQAQPTDDDYYTVNGNNKTKILWVEIKDFISVGTSEDVKNAIEVASSSSQDFTAVILALDTPGGSLDATLEIIESIQRSDVPVIGYVFPQGKSAWSAGTIILLATDYAAMAPFTTIGSAQPVLGSEPINDTKVINALTEKVESLAQLHGRNVTQAIRFITDNDNLTPEKAIDKNIIEAIADNPQDLLEKAHNVTVTTLQGTDILNTKDSQIVEHQPSLRVMIVDALASPLISATFLTLGFFAVIYGLTSPGFGAEIAGAVLVILGLMGQGFDINWSAFGLLALGVGLVAYELYNPGFGALGIGGIIVLIMGSALMITQPVRPLLVTEEHIGNVALLSVMIIAPFSALLGIVTYKAWKSKQRAKVDFALQTNEGTAIDFISRDKVGFVSIGGEYWRARTDGYNIEVGKKVRVIKKEGDILIVSAQ